MSKIPTSYCLPKLHALAGAQDENFLTTSFAHVLVAYLETESACAIQLLQYLYPEQQNLDAESLQTISVHTQYTTKLGVPDIVIRSPDAILYVEAKVDSGFGDKQLERYFDALQNEDEPNKYLVTLTRYASDNDDVGEISNLRWYELADVLSSLEPNTDVGKYLKHEFLELLTHRGVNMETVSWELAEGVRSFRSLVAMVGETLRLRNISIHQRSGAWDYYGYYIGDGPQLFVGFYLDEPEVLVVITNRKIKESDGGEPELGRFKGTQWLQSIDLSSEDVHFYSRSRASQMQFLESWIGEAVDFGFTMLDK